MKSVPLLGVESRTRQRNGEYVAEENPWPLVDDPTLVQEVERQHVRAQLLFTSEKYGEAVEGWKKALATARRLQDAATRKSIQPVLAGALGCALDLGGDPEGAVGWHAKAFKVNGEIGDYAAQGADMTNTGNAYLNAAVAPGADQLAAVNSAHECFALAAQIAQDGGFEDLAKRAADGLARTRCAAKKSGGQPLQGSPLNAARAAARQQDKQVDKHERLSRADAAKPPADTAVVRRTQRPRHRASA